MQRNMIDIKKKIKINYLVIWNFDFQITQELKQIFSFLIIRESSPKIHVMRKNKSIIRFLDLSSWFIKL